MKVATFIICITTDNSMSVYVRWLLRYDRLTHLNVTVADKNGGGMGSNNTTVAFVFSLTNEHDWRYQVSIMIRTSARQLTNLQ